MGILILDGGMPGSRSVFNYFSCKEMILLIPGNDQVNARIETGNIQIHIPDSRL
jgi:hypothetical protein